MLATVVRAEDDPTLGPRDEGVVECEPGHAEDNRVMTKACRVELDGF